MKIEEYKRDEFRPIEITIETRDELDDLRSILTISNAADWRTVFPGVVGPPFLQKILAEGLRKIVDRLDKAKEER